MEKLHDYLCDALEGPNGQRLTSWAFTLLFVSCGVLATIFAPINPLMGWFIVGFLCLFVWEAYYDGFIGMAHKLQTREAIGARAVFVHIRIAIAGACALIVLGVLMHLSIGNAITSRFVAAYCCFVGIALVFSIAFVQLRKVLLESAKCLINLPFQIAFVWAGAVRDRDTLFDFHKRLNAHARWVFGIVTGYPSNITFLMESDQILKSLPTWR